MPLWGKTEDPPEVAPEVPEVPEIPAEPVIPVSERPNVVDSPSGDSFDFGEPEDEPEPSSDGGKATYFDAEGVERYVGSNRKKRSDAGTGRRGVSRKRKAVTKDPAAAGGTILYGGIGAVLSISGVAPAAGLSMQGLADEAGPEIADWAKKRSPRFHHFLAQLADASGIGKFVSAPIAAEAYLRVEKARPALGPAVVAMHGADSAAAFDALTEQYDQWKATAEAAAHAETNGGTDVPEA